MMDQIKFRYRSRELSLADIQHIQGVVSAYYGRGRSFISRILCHQWQWLQPNGRLKEYAARDLLLRLEEKGLIHLPPRLRQKNNHRLRPLDQMPLFSQDPLTGYAGNYGEARLHVAEDRYLWDWLIHHYHYLGLPTPVGEHVRYFASIGDQIVACLLWASAAWKIKDRDRFIGWDESMRRKNLHLIANNTRFLILPWINVKYLASRILSLNVRRLRTDWERIYGHPLYLVETFVDISRFHGTCYRAANWQWVGCTKGSAKRGNSYSYHGQPKAIYLYPLHPHFQRYLLDDQG